MRDGPSKVLINKPSQQSSRQAPDTHPILETIDLAGMRARSSKFVPNGIPPQSDVRCMFCGAVERNRLTWRVFEDKTNLFDGQGEKMLQVGAEDFFETRETQGSSCAGNAQAFMLSRCEDFRPEQTSAGHSLFWSIPITAHVQDTLRR